MYCSHCGQKLNDDAKYCFACGSRVASNYTDSRVDTGSRTVSNDSGYRATGAVSRAYPTDNQYQRNYYEPEPQYLDGHNPLVIALVCFFLGGIGVHNFVMGEAKKGVLKLLTCWFYLGIILALIDFIKILAGKYQINPHKFI